MRILLVALAMAAALSGCGERRPAGPAAGPAPVAADAAVEVAAIDEIGPLADEASGLAFWLHPAIPFNSLVIAATPSGLVAYNIEDGAEVARSVEFDARAVDLFYAGAASPDAETSARQAVGVMIAADAAGAWRAFEIDNVSRAFKPLAAPAAPPPGNAHCAGPASGSAARLAVVAGATLVLHDVERTADGLSLAESGRSALPARAVACAIDPAGGGLHVLLENGDIWRRIEADGAQVDSLIATGAERPSGIAIAVNDSPEGANDPLCCGEIVVLDAGAATLRIFDLRDGRAIGAIRLKSSFDVEGVASATALGVGVGNFGGAYRDGVVGLAADGASPALRLTPLNGVMDALGRPIGAPHDPRTAKPRAGDRPCAAQTGLCPDADAFALPAPGATLPE